MKTMPGSKVSPPIFIGRWTPQILFSLKERPRRHGELRRHLGRVLAAHAYQNSAQSGIHRASRQARDRIEGDCC